jgi:hypothetical protein
VFVDPHNVLLQIDLELQNPLKAICVSAMEAVPDGLIASVETSIGQFFPSILTASENMPEPTSK